MPTRALFLVLCLAAIVAGGCTERRMVIESDPPGALVVVNETWRGTTPFTMPFRHYGVYQIRLEKDGYHPMVVKEPVEAPWYEHTGPDLINAALVPKRTADVHHLVYQLSPVETERDISGLLARSEAFAERVGAVVQKQRREDAQRRPLEFPLLPVREGIAPYEAPDAKDEDEDDDAAMDDTPATDGRRESGDAVATDDEARTLTPADTE